MLRSTFRGLVLALLAGPAAAQTFTVSTQDFGGGIVSVQSGPIQGGPARDQPPPTGSARIRGRLTDATTGAPLRRAAVRTTAPELRGQRMAQTDVNGRFEFADLPAGRYSVSANKSGYVDMSYGALGPMEPGKNLTLADKQTIDNINFALPRGSVITGRVVDELGEPVSDAMVVPMRTQYTATGRRPMPAGRSTQTNDIGEFRLFGLTPGQYIISVTYRQPMMYTPMNSQLTANSDRTGYAPTYYPGTPNIAEAQTISVGTSELLPEIGIMLVPTRTAIVKGTALDGTGRPIKDGMVMARQVDSFGGFGNANGQIREGSFTIAGLAAGDYILMAMISNGMNGPSTNGPPEQSVARITVNGNDLDGVVLAPMKPVELTGRVIADGAAASSLRPQMFRFMAQPKNPADNAFMGMGGGPPQPVKDDLTFTLRAFPGDVLILPMAMPPGWMVRRMRLNGEDITDGFTLRADERGTIEVEISNQAPTLSGMVTNRRGETATEYFAILFPEDFERRPAIGPGHYAQARPDQNGKYTVRNLLPGTYFAVAVGRIQQGQNTDPEFLARVRASATRLTLQEGESKTLDLRLVE